MRDNKCLECLVALFSKKSNSKIFWKRRHALKQHNQPLRQENISDMKSLEERLH